VTARRPRLIVPLGVVGYLCAVIGLTVAWSSARGLLGSHDHFVSARKDPTLVLGVPKDLGTSDERVRIAERGAETLWSRRGVLLPLAGMNAIASLLVLFGAARVVSPRSRKARWGRSAWQLGVLLWLPYIGVSAVVTRLRTQELLTAIADLHDPVAEWLRAILAQAGSYALAQDGLSVAFAALTAAYLATQKVTRYCELKDGVESA
jgi:hypothetical protein